jgi:hypothetical protein
MPEEKMPPWKPEMVNQPAAEEEVGRRRNLPLAKSCRIRFTAALEEHAHVIAAGVTKNLYQRHIRPLLLEPN